MDIGWFSALWGFSFLGGCTACGQHGIKARKGGIYCDSKSLTSLEARAPPTLMQQGRGSRTHETRPSRWGSSVMIDLGLRETLSRVWQLSVGIGTLPLASDCI